MKTIPRLTIFSCRPSNKAKPNTRFLRHIIRETKNHNEALLAKEASESQARLSELAEAEAARRRRLKPVSGDMRRRQLGDITAILEGRKRKRDDREDGSRAPGGSGAREHRRDEPTDQPLADSATGGRAKPKHATKRTDSHEPRDKSKGHRLHESPDVERRRRKKRDRSRSPSPRRRERRHRCRSPLDDKYRGKHKSDERRHRHRDKSYRNEGADLFPLNKRTRELERGDDESDPLEDLIGPRPPSQLAGSRPRGRGSAKGPSAMDGRFKGNYDPASDLQPELDEVDDWDGALEALRDRQKWKQQGAERLRTAGFTAQEIDKWARGGEKDIQDVQWSKAGESREWDQGKSSQH